MAETLDRTYAEGLLTVVEAEGVLERVEDELYQVARLVEGNTELREQLSDASVPVEQRLGVIEELLGDQAHQQTVAAVSYIVQAGRGRQLAAVADAFAELAAERRSRALAEVRTAVELSEEQRERLARALGEATGQQIDLKVVVDPAIMGGVVATVGETVIDGSVARRLEDVRARLTSS
ncbi:MAG: ATP synthase F1 subunit delta [Egibacteraceae bacterium]